MANEHAIIDPEAQKVTGRIVSPTHPGTMIRRAIAATGLNLTQAAKAIRTPLPFLSNMLNGKRPISFEMALRIEAGFGLNAQMIHGMSDLWESAKALERRDEIVNGIERVPPRMDVAA